MSPVRFEAAPSGKDWAMPNNARPGEFRYSAAYRQLATTLPSARAVSLSVADPFMPSPNVTAPCPGYGT
jgi:hypothetical protein